MNLFSYDILIIGHGVSALQALARVNHAGRIALLADSREPETSAFSEKPDVRSLRETGCFHNDPQLVRILCEEAGRMTETAPAKADLLPGCALRLYVKDNRAQGVLGYDQGRFFLVSAPKILLCGSEKGSVLSMAYYGGVRLADLEFCHAEHPLGGMIVDDMGRTNVRGLYAAGCWTAGLQGAAYQKDVPSLAACVFSRRAARDMAAQAPSQVDQEALTAWGEETASTGNGRIAHPMEEIEQECAPALKRLRFPCDEMMLEEALQAVSYAQHELNELPPAMPEEAYLRLRLEDRLIAKRLHIFSAMERRDTLGCFVRKDYPQKAAVPYRICMGLQGMLLWPEKEDWQKQSQEDA